MRDETIVNPYASESGDETATSCSRCGAVPAQINEFMSVMSFLVFTNHGRYTAQLCRDCTTRQALKEHTKSSVLGWWGVPWGLMTLQAIWINTRTLLRWSRLGGVAALSVGLLGLSAPVALGYFVYRTTVEENLASSTGDWVNDDVRELVESGHEAVSRQDLDAALEFYTRAAHRAPESSVVNFAVATTLYELGREDEALPYAAEAESRNPRSRAHRAFRGILFSHAGNGEESRQRARALADEIPDDAGEAYWMAELFRELQEMEQLERVAAHGRRLQSGDPYFRVARLHALLELDRVDEARTIIESLDPGELEGGDLGHMNQVYRMRIAPLESIEELFQGWAGGLYGPEFMTVLAQAAQRSGEMDAVRSRVGSWLTEPDTPPEAWLVAQAWFDDAGWVAALDRMLAAEPAVAPSLMRIQTLDAVSDAEQILRIAARARTGDDPLMPYLDVSYFEALARTRSYRESLNSLEAHMQEFPDHVLCAYRMAALQALQDPDLARTLWDRVERLANGDPALLADLELQRLELDLASGDPAEVLSKLIRRSGNFRSALRAPYFVDLMVAEAAFHAGDLDTMNRRIDRVLATAPVDSHAAALLIRWCSQWAAGSPISYREDVEQWLGSDDSGLRRSESLTAQGVLLAEGRVDREWVRRASADRPGETVTLVAAVRSATSAPGTADETLRAVARSTSDGGFARRLAQTVLRLREARGG